MNPAAIERLRAVLGARAKTNVNLAPHTTFRISGPADLFARARSVEELVEWVTRARDLGVPAFILGRGSNILVSDRGIRGLVIENRAEHFEIRTMAGERATVYAESGATLPTLAQRLSRAGWRGFEWAIGVPGTVGAGVVGNVGAHGASLADSLIRVWALDAENTRVEIAARECELTYRSSRFKKDKRFVLLAAEFELRRDEINHCLARLAEYSEQRRKTQPREPSVGSMFKNPPGDFAGRLIEAARLKGTRVGNVEVSPVHANFFVNRGGARAAEVVQLIELVKSRVREKFGVELELEIELVGEW
jgi:UDP-N-acetylmuramate dehydrogenase